MDTSETSEKKSNFLSISQLMNATPPNKNRYRLSVLQQEDDSAESDDNIPETYASVVKKQQPSLIIY